MNLAIYFSSSGERWFFLAYLLLFLATAATFVVAELRRERAEREQRLRRRVEPRNVRIVRPEHLEVQQ